MNGATPVAIWESPMKSVVTISPSRSPNEFAVSSTNVRTAPKLFRASAKSVAPSPASPVAARTTTGSSTRDFDCDGLPLPNELFLQSLDQLIVGFVGADPKPLKRISVSSRESAIVISNASAPDVAAQRHEFERRMPRVVREQFEFLIGKSLRCLRQFVVASPEGFARDVLHARLKPCVTSPAAMSLSN